MSATRSLFVAALAAGTLAAAKPAAAQLPSPTLARRVAGQAVSATNAHTAAMTNVEPSAAPSAARPSASPASQGVTAAPAARAQGVPADDPATTGGAGDGAVRTGGRSVSVTVNAAGTELPDEVSFVRETYSYASGGRRDPFVSLMATGELRPMLSDLRLVGVAYDPSGRNSVAIMRDVSTKEQYRVKVGQTLGRMRAARIQPRQVVFTIEEFGLSRQEILALSSDSTTARTK
jgi:hypothetical protein